MNYPSVSQAALLAAAPYAVLTVDAEGYVVDLNSAAVDAFGYRPPEPIGWLISELVIDLPAPGLLGEGDGARGSAEAVGAWALPLLGRMQQLTARRADESRFPVEFALSAAGEDSTRLSAWTRAAGSHALRTPSGPTAEALVGQLIKARLAVSETLANWESFERRIVDLLRSLVEPLDYGLATLWVPEDGVRCARAGWSVPPVQGSEFERVTRSLRLPKGVGLPGWAWQTGTPVELFSAPAIAAHLTIERSTVKTHLEHIYANLGVCDRASAVAFALRRGLLR